MAHTIQGDLLIKRTGTAERRLNQGLSRETLTGQRAVIENDYAWLDISNASTQDVVLPDATTLANGWEIVVSTQAGSAASVNVMSYDAVTPVLLRNIISDRAYRFTLRDNSAAAGVWHVDFLEEADKIPVERYIDSFNATSDWSGPSAGYYTRTLTQATHGRGATPIVMVQSGTNPGVNITPDAVSIASNGDSTIKVPSSPDLRFAGRVIYV